MEEKKSGIKKFFEEFKAFAMRGNVLDMAVGVVIGGAFTAIVTALVEDIINPLIGLFFKADFSDVVIGLGGSSIKIGEFVNSIINFLIVAFVLFVVIKFVNSLHRKPEAPAEPEEPTTKVCPYCQSEISIKAVRCPHCTSKLEGFPEAFSIDNTTKPSRSGAVFALAAGRVLHILRLGCGKVEWENQDILLTEPWSAQPACGRSRCCRTHRRTSRHRHPWRTR